MADVQVQGKVEGYRVDLYSEQPNMEQAASPTVLRQAGQGLASRGYGSQAVATISAGYKCHPIN